MHSYALELQTGRVWDYAGDGYVHRLVQNKSDGKLVQVPEPTLQLNNNNSSVNNMSEQEMTKIESLSLEYGYLLEAQKKYFDEQIRKIELNKTRKIVQLEEEYAQLLESKVQIERKMLAVDEERKKKGKENNNIRKTTQTNC